MGQLNSLVIAIVERAAAEGLSQKMLASRAHIAEASLSRMKRRSSVNSDVLERLAKAAGMRLAVVANDVEGDQQPGLKVISAAGTGPAKTGFAQRHPELVWSNPDAPVEVFLRRALLRPEFSVLLDAAAEMGVGPLEQQWALLQAEAGAEALRAAPVTTRMLRNIRHGYEQAAA